VGNAIFVVGAFYLFHLATGPKQDSVWVFARVKESTPIGLFIDNASYSVQFPRSFSSAPPIPAGVNYCFLPTLPLWENMSTVLSAIPVKALPPASACTETVK
jgi:hypothetical protein